MPKAVIRHPLHEHRDVQPQVPSSGEQCRVTGTSENEEVGEIAGADGLEQYLLVIRRRVRERKQLRANRWGLAARASLVECVQNILGICVCLRVVFLRKAVVQIIRRVCVDGVHVRIVLRHGFGRFAQLRATRAIRPHADQSQGLISFRTARCQTNAHGDIATSSAVQHHDHVSWPKTMALDLGNFQRHDERLTA